MRNLMTLCCAAALAAIVSGCAPKGGNFTLVKDRKPAAVFLVTKEQAAAKSIAYYKLPGYCGEWYGWQLDVIGDVIKDFNEDLKECTGVEVPVVDADDGKTPVIKFALEPRPLPDEDRFTITFPDTRTMLITGSAFAPRWALNHILEKFAGVRWLARSKNSAHFPQINDLIVPRIEISLAPSFNLHRDTYIADGYWFGRAYDKWRINFIHGIWRVAFPVKKYMAENKWPEFIFPTIDGKKFLPYLPVGNPVFKTPQDYESSWQPCLTSKATVDEAIKNIGDYFDKNPEAVSVSVSINDMGGFCQCDNCRKLGGLKRTILGHWDYSELYYQWVNQVVEAVAQNHPDKYFGVVAYREALTPPSFKLHKNIVVVICFDAQACMLDQEVKASRLALFKGWSAKAANLGWAEYGWGGGCMDLPRVYFGWQQEMMRIAHTNNVRAMYVQAEGAIEDGPKKYLYQKLMWDVNLDLDALLKDWYEACVGKAAAPYLAEYFQLWEKFWREEAVKTDWFISSRKATYLSQANKTYLFAVGREDLPRMRTLMEKVVELAGQSGDTRQKLRAQWLMREFEYSEACVYAIGGQIFPHSGAVENVGQALEYLQSLPEAAKYDAKRAEIFKERKTGWGKGAAFGNFYGFYVPVTLARVASFCSDPQVMAAFRAAAQNPALNTETRGLCDVFVKLESNQPVENLLKDGSFETGDGLSLDTSVGWIGGNIASNKAYRGKNSLMVNLPQGTSGIAVKSRFSGKPGSYLFSAMIYLKQDHPDVEEKVVMRAVAQQKKGGPDVNAWTLPETYIKTGEWTRISLVADIPPDIETFGLAFIGFKNFAKGDVAYIDDVIIAPLGGERQNAGK